MKTALWAAAALATAGLALPAPSRADTRFGIGIVAGSDYYGDRQGEAYRYGYERGSREGAEHGFKDGRRGKSPNPWRHGEYRDGDHGYHGWMGPRWDYASGYRRGYETSYRRAFSSSGPAYRDGDDRYGYRDHDRY